jgi:NAD(P)-dependent dehydrogenase (short-subunit alcohol dehydrogenase family)
MPASLSEVGADAVETATPVRAKRGGGSAEFLSADLSTLAEVRRLAEAVQQRTDRLDILINSAGIGSSGSGGAPRRATADGYELRFAVNLEAQRRIL